MWQGSLRSWIGALDELSYTTLYAVTPKDNFAFAFLLFFYTDGHNRPIEEMCTHHSVNKAFLRLDSVFCNESSLKHL